jgi:hypothetical protein
VQEVNPSINILAIFGSLRVRSLNTIRLRAVQRLAPTDIRIELYRGLGELAIRGVLRTLQRISLSVMRPMHEDRRGGQVRATRVLPT